MDYKRIYNEIILNRKNNPFDGYTEKHHILPRSLGGSDDNSNLVNLSAREHYICHLLLTKMYDKNSTSYYKMIHAFIMMCNVKSNNQNRFYKVNSKLYSNLKTEYSMSLSIEQTGDKNSQFDTVWIYSEINRDTRKISNCDKIPEGWFKGRVLDFSYLDRLCNICNEHMNLKNNTKHKKICSYCSKVNRKPRTFKGEYKKCYCNGLIFNSVDEASKSLNINKITLRKRITSNNNELYYYC